MIKILIPDACMIYLAIKAACHGSGGDFGMTMSIPLINPDNDNVIAVIMLTF